MKASRSALAAVAALLFTVPCGAQQTGSDYAIPVGKVSGATLLPVTVPYTLDSGLMVVRATVGQSDEQLAVIDTSLPTCLVTPALASSLRLLTENTTEVQTLYGAIRVPMAHPQGLKVGGLVMTDVGMGAESPLEVLSSRRPAKGPAIWIGGSALSALTVTIDPVAKTITFADTRAQLPKKALVVPFKVQNGRIVLEVRANDSVSFSAVLSTGCTGTLLPAHVITALKLKDAATIAIQHPNGRPGTAAVVDLDELSIGQVKIPAVPAVYLHSDQPASKDELGVIGTDVLGEYRVTIQYALRKIAFEPLTAPDPVATAVKPDRRNGDIDMKTNPKRGFPRTP